MEAPLPDTLEAAVRWLLGGVLIFAFGFESVVMLWDGKFLFSLCSIVIAASLTLLLVYWSYVPTIILVLTGIVGIASIPLVFYGIVRFIRARQVPKSMLMLAATFLFAVALIAALAGGALVYTARTQAAPSQNSSADVAKATATLKAQIEQLQVALESATRQRDVALSRQQQTASVPQVSPSPQSAPNAQDIATKIGIWMSVDQQMNGFAQALNQGYLILDNWPNRVKSNRNEVVSQAETFRVSLKEDVDKLEGLRIAYPNYADVSEALNTHVLDSLFRSIEGFRQAVATLPNDLPDNYENIIRPYAGALKRDLDAIANWQSVTRQTALHKGKELSLIESK